MHAAAEPANEPEPEGLKACTEEEMEESDIDEDDQPYDGEYEPLTAADADAPVESCASELEQPGTDIDEDASSAAACNRWSGLRLRLPGLASKPQDAPVKAESEAIVEKSTASIEGDTTSAPEVTDDEVAKPAGESEDGTDCGELAKPGSPDMAGGWLVMDRAGLVMSEEEALTTGAVESKVEQLLTWMLSPAIHGILKLGVPSAADRAEELLAMHRRDVDAAAREVVAGSERTVSLLVLNFCLERIPVFGCPTVLLKTTWGNLRSVFIIAALYGHDLQKPRVQHEALFCLVPPGKDAANAQSSWRGDGRGSAQQAELLRDTTQKVARMMIKGALRRATGLQAAVDCFELASLLYSSCGQEALDDDGFVHITPTPASAARDLFRQKSLASTALLWCSLPLLLLGSFAPMLFNALCRIPSAIAAVRSAARVLPSSFFFESLPAFMLATLAVGILGRGLAVQGHARERRGRLGRLWRRLASMGRRREERIDVGWLATQLQALRDAWPRIVTALVFALHALLPAVSTYSAVAVILSATFGYHDSGEPDPNGWDLLHRCSTAGLGIYMLSSVVQRHIESEWPDHEAGPLVDGCGRRLRLMLRLLGCTETLARLLSMLCAWAYAALLLELAAARLVRGLFALSSSSSSATDDSSVFGIMAPMAWAFGAVPGTNPLRSTRAIATSLQLISIASQRRLVDLLSRREVLLRLIGAEKLTAQTLLLLFKGVGVAMDGPWGGSSPIADFIESVSPPPLCCAIIVTLRGQAVVLGSFLVLAPWLTMSSPLGSVPCFALGILAGAFAAQAVLRVWYANHADLASPALRLALLVPGGLSSRAKGLLRGALEGARKRAVQMMAISLFERFIRWWLRPLSR